MMGFLKDFFMSIPFVDEADRLINPKKRRFGQPYRRKPPSPYYTLHIEILPDDDEQSDTRNQL